MAGTIEELQRDRVIHRLLKMGVDELYDFYVNAAMDYMGEQLSTSVYVRGAGAYKDVGVYAILSSIQGNIGEIDYACMNGAIDKFNARA